VPIFDGRQPLQDVIHPGLATDRQILLDRATDEHGADERVELGKLVTRTKALAMIARSEIAVGLSNLGSVRRGLGEPA
jgi:hypothetical protein